MYKTLSSFTWLLDEKQQVIQCSQIYLDGWDDFSPPIFEGSGTLTILGASEFRFEVLVQPSDEGKAIRALNQTLELPYESSTALRLRAVDSNGNEWNCGWVRPRSGEVNEKGWQLYGKFSVLSTHAKQTNPGNGVELIYFPPPEVPFSQSRQSTRIIDSAEPNLKRSERCHVFDVLDSNITVRSESDSNMLWIVATASSELNHPYLENWLSEPLRVLRGQLIFPRLVARNFANGQAMVTLRRSPSIQTSLGGNATLLRDRSAKEFWDFYEKYLTYIAQYRNKDDSREFEAHPLTRFHEEVIQARLAGSHWVIALCAASAIEGIVKLGPELAKTETDFTKEEISQAISYLTDLQPKKLRDRLCSMTAQLQRPSPVRYLSTLMKDNVITFDQLDAWNKIRNRVAHGNLFEPWGTEISDTQLTNLIKLLYCLTAIRIGY